MAVGRAEAQIRFDDAAGLLGDRLAPGSVYHLLAGEGQRLFPDDYFAELFLASAKGRPTVPARVVATTMLLQAHEGLSDREAVEHLAFDLRWKAAAGLAVDAGAFHATVLVGIRNRLRKSDRPRRLFEDVRAVAKAAGLLRGRNRVLDSTPVYDAVSTQDTVTQLRAVIRKVLMVADREGAAGLAAAVRAVLTRDDDYATAGKPPCDWDDKTAREELVDALVRDCLAVLAVLDGRELSTGLAEAAELLALVAGQDVAEGDDGVFRIARRVKPDRVISTVDTQARHGHKSRNRSFDGYKAHLSVDPDDELIDEVAVTPANTPDRDAVGDLLGEHTTVRPTGAIDTETAGSAEGTHVGADDDDVAVTTAPDTVTGEDATGRDTTEDEPHEGGENGLNVFGDSAYADADTLDELEEQGHTPFAKVPPTRNRDGLFSKDQFDIDLDKQEVTCPAGNTAPVVAHSTGGGTASFGDLCTSCPLRDLCTTSATGRTVTIHPREATLTKHRSRQADTAWKQRYRATRPKVERKIGHFVRRSWGGRRARTRGKARILTDVLTRAAVLNLARLGVLGLRHEPSGWAVNPG
ncbi:MAG TPA: transposase [Actinomycetes bacterium]|nr:transposase [Actinomycetes bacterium]